MKLNQSPEPVVRVDELAKELGWPAKQFATNSNATTSDGGLNPDGHGKSASANADEPAKDSFAAALAQARSYSVSTGTGPQAARWRPRTVRVYLRELSNAPRAAKVLFTHRNTIRTRIARAEHLLPRPLSHNSLEVAVALELAAWMD
jgi:PucR C-terminal helix-turn-helix domain